MPRLARNEIAAGIWHVYARGVERRSIFVDDDDRRRYLQLLALVVSTFGWRCLGYCLMPNHVHLLIETREPNLGKGMHSLHGRYARHFNDRHARVGHLFQSRFGSKEIAGPLEVVSVLSYIAANPVHADLCARAEDYRWSSDPAQRTGRNDRVVDVARARDFLSAFGDAADVYSYAVEARCLNLGLRELG